MNKKDLGLTEPVVDNATNETRGVTRAYVRTYSDSGQTTAYVEWNDGSRTEGNPTGLHMQALFQRAEREGLKVERETW